MTASRTRISRRLLLAGLMAGGADIALANAPARSLRPAARPGSVPVAVPEAEPRLRPRPRPVPPAPPEAAELVAEARLGRRAQVSFLAVDMETGAVVDALDPLISLPPASVNKAVTALYALESLGPEHRFTTRLIATGPVANGRLEGDLVLAGTGDPTLDTDGLAELAARLKATGLREVAGRFLIWDGDLPLLRAIDPTQPDHVGYNPAVGALNLNFNRVHFEWKREGGRWATTMDARSATHRPEVRVARMSIVDRSMPVYTYEFGEGVDRWTVAAGALGNGGSRWLPVRHPALYCAEVFATFARAQGIVLKAPARAEAAPRGAVLAELESAPMREVLRDMLKYSTNVTAEAVGLAATSRRAERPADLTASAERMSAWLGGRIASDRPALVDHSGLGDRSRLCASDMVQALVRLGPTAGLAPILRDIPMRDEKYRRVESHAATVVAKTGTLNFVSALAGYVTLRSGRQMAFATFSGDTERRAGIPRADREAPEGAAPWAARARILQMRLIDRWSRLPA